MTNLLTKINKIMKTTRTLNAISKSEKQATKQAKRWFQRNPNRKVVDVKLTDKVLKFKRSDLVK